MDSHVIFCDYSLYLLYSLYIQNPLKFKQIRKYNTKTRRKIFQVRQENVNRKDIEPTLLPVKKRR